MASAMLLAGLTVAGATASVAQEYCVSCKTPNAIYRCVIADPRPGAAPSLQAACLQALSKDGGHAECSVQRGVTVFQCDGPVKRITLGSSVPAVPADPVVGERTPADKAIPNTARVETPPPAPPVDPNAPPKTLLEAAQRAKLASDKSFGQTNEKMKQAGDATSTFFEQSLRCLGSFFTSCGTAPQRP